MHTPFAKNLSPKAKTNPGKEKRKKNLRSLPAPFPRACCSTSRSARSACAPINGRKASLNSRSRHRRKKAGPADGTAACKNASRLKDRERPGDLRTQVSGLPFGRPADLGARKLKGDIHTLRPRPVRTTISVSSFTAFKILQNNRSER